jgi:hypothetical protein
MPKKTKNRSSKPAKQHRQNIARDHRRHGIPVVGDPNAYDHSAMLETFHQHWAVDSIRMLCSDGEVRHLTVARAHACVNAELVADGEPAADLMEARDIVGEDILNGDMVLRPDGVWEGPADYYFTSEEPGA